MKQPKETSGEVFYQKDEGRINASSQKDAQFFQIAGNQRDQSSQSVNGEHQKGGLSDQPFIIGGSQIVKAAEKKFSRPPDQAAADKILFKIREGKAVCFHGKSMCRFSGSMLSGLNSCEKMLR